MVKKVNIGIYAAIFILAGLNHFRSPEVYEAMIPPYLPWPSLINITSGIVEIITGILVFHQSTRRLSAYISITLLILFIPAHIFLIQKEGCVHAKLCISEWIAVLRLFPLQFMMMWWIGKTIKQS